MFSKIKLFVDAHVFDIHRQGTSTYVAGLYNQLLNYSDLEIFFGVYNVDKLKSEIPRARNIIKYRKSGFVPRYITEVPRILEEYGFDYAHFQYIVPLMKKKTKYINTVHDVLFLDYPQYFSPFFRVSRKFLFRSSLKRSDIKLTVSEYSKKRISHHFNIGMDDIHITPNAGPVLQPNDKKESRLFVYNKYKIKSYILYVSRIELRKNHQLLIEAFETNKLDQYGYQLVFVGKADHKKSAANIKIEKKVLKNKAIKILSDVGAKDLEHLYNAAELFVYPSLAEGFGIPPLEAASCNVPVLCSNKTAMNDFTFFQNGLFDPERKGELTQKIKSVLIDKDSILPINLQNNIAVKYNWVKSAKKLFQLIQ